MTRDEALRELGIDASATPEEARRAYLRGIKTRKPETDPEGFRRLREAYELLAEARETRQESPGAPFEEIEEALVVEPTAPAHALALLQRDVRGGAAERGRAERREHDDDFAERRPVEPHRRPSVNHDRRRIAGQVCSTVASRS